MQKQKTKSPKARTRNNAGPGRATRRPRHAKPAAGRPGGALDAALTAAAALAAPYPEELESVERVMEHVRRHRHGQGGDFRLSDALTALAIIITASTADRDVTEEERDVFSRMDSAFGPPRPRNVAPAHLRCVRASYPRNHLTP